MLRWQIIRTLLYKEMLRYRYNWGLIVMVVALLALSALVSISARLNRLPGQTGVGLDWCRIYYSSAGDPRVAQLVDHLVNHSTPPGELRYNDLAPRKEPPMASELISFRPNSIVLIIAPPTGTGSGASGNPRGEVWTARFLYYGSEPPPGMAAYRAWFLRETHRFLNSEPRVDEELNGRKPLSGAIDVTDWISMIETALVLFALYFMAFNIFMTSTGEEREKRILLALLLTPARPVEIVAAKGIFYAAGSLLVATAIVAMYHPSYLATTAFWPTVILGSLCYLSIATVFLSIVRRQTTITMISMLYLISTLIIMILGEPYALPMPFYFLRGMLVEHYLHSLIFQIMSDQRGFTFGWYLIILLGLTFVWGVIAVITFSRKGIAISQGR